MPDIEKVSISVVRRLPRYYRFLGQLLASGTTRISSGELARRMGLTASQIRHDLNCFGGFGQQGYGYDVARLKDAIGGILGLQNTYKAILVGFGNLGKAVAGHINFPDRGFTLEAIFDSSPEVIGSQINDWVVQDCALLFSYCAEHKPDAAFLCLPTASAGDIVDMLYNAGIRAFWNFSHFDITLRYPDAIMENVHLTDSLMTLCYRMSEGSSGEA